MPRACLSRCPDSITAAELGRRRVFSNVECHRSGVVHLNDDVTEGTVHNDEQMTTNARRKYLRLTKKRCLKASKLGRGRVLASSFPGGRLLVEEFRPIIVLRSPRGRCVEEQLRAAADVVDGNFAPRLGFHLQGDQRR